MSAPPSPDPALLRRLLRAKNRMDIAAHEEWPVGRLARVSRVSTAREPVSRHGSVDASCRDPSGNGWNRAAT